MKALQLLAADVHRKFIISKICLTFFSKIFSSNSRHTYRLDEFSAFTVIFKSLTGALSLAWCWKIYLYLPSRLSYMSGELVNKWLISC